MVCEGNYFFPINTNYRYYFLKRTKSINKIVSLRKIINGIVKVICYNWKYFLTPCLRYISYNYYNTFSRLQIIMKYNDNITDEKNRRESIELERSVSIVTQDTTYDYNDDFCYLI